MNTGNVFHFPENCHVGQRIAKVLFDEHGPLTPHDRQTFRKDIEEAVCAYVLQSDKVSLNAWSDGEHDYDSLTFVEVSLRKTGKAERIAELFHRSIPYPLILCLRDTEGNVMFSMAEKRISRDGREQVVVERMVCTPWQDEQSLEAFLAEADFGKFTKTTFRDLHEHYVKLLEALCAASVTGELRTQGVDPIARRQGLEQLHRLNQELAALRTKIKQESAMLALVELNMKSHEIKQQIAELIKNL